MTRPFRSAPPKASAMLESLRGLGYSPETAIADTIDNSISARAANVHLTFKWDGKNSYIAIVDDGCGMSVDALDSAMRLGDRDPLQQRGAGDLGRFGLGLKTAALSQGRRLTVLSRDSLLNDACFSWDLDVLAEAKDGDWRLLEGPDYGSRHILTLLPVGRPGTLVLWEVLDRLVPAGTNQQDFLDTIDRVERHLAMVFHRFLEGSRPRLKLTINGEPVHAWNPFSASVTAPPWSSPVDYLNSDTSECSVQCFVLPHRDRLTKGEFDSAAGVSGWNAQQGFYVYRNERLLVAGSWLGLGSPRIWTKDEVHRLARIRLDIKNESDSDWKIDIRKSIAKPPFGIRQRLTSLGEDTRRRARAVFAHRGTVPRRPNDEPIFEAWESVVTAGVTRYKVNRNHPAVRSVLDSPLAIDGEVDVMLNLLESTIPVQRIWLDTVEERTAPHAEPDGDEEKVKQMLDVIYRSLLNQQYSSERARERLLRTEPFQRYPKLVANLPENSPTNEGSIENA
jgi:Histidine kinase-, DNA gyrase B-, and HSP90-like ATPase